jgi:hypothetical protein
VSGLITTLSYVAGVVTGLAGLFVIARFALNFEVVQREVREINRELNDYIGIRPRRFQRPRPPSLSRGLLRLAERRLPSQMDHAEKERWAQEMRADVASLPRPRRLWVAFNIWRKGAPKMPVGAGKQLAAPTAGD